MPSRTRWAIPTIVITPPTPLPSPPPRVRRRPVDCDRLWVGWCPRGETSFGRIYYDEDEYDMGLLDAIVAVFGLSALASYWSQLAPAFTAAVAPLAPLVSPLSVPLSSSSSSSSSSSLFSLDADLCLPGIPKKARQRRRLAPLALFLVLLTAALALTSAFQSAQLFPGLEAKEVGLFLPQHHANHYLHAHVYDQAHSGPVWDPLLDAAPADAAFSPPVGRDKLDAWASQ